MECSKCNHICELIHLFFSTNFRRFLQRRLNEIFFEDLSSYSDKFINRSRNSLVIFFQTIFPSFSFSSNCNRSESSSRYSERNLNEDLVFWLFNFMVLKRPVFNSFSLPAFLSHCFIEKLCVFSKNQVVNVNLVIFLTYKISIHSNISSTSLFGFENQSTGFTGWSLDFSKFLIFSTFFIYKYKSTLVVRN